MNRSGPVWPRRLVVSAAVAAIVPAAAVCAAAGTRRNRMTGGCRSTAMGPAGAGRDGGTRRHAVGRTSAVGATRASRGRAGARGPSANRCAVRPAGACRHGGRPGRRAALMRAARVGADRGSLGTASAPTGSGSPRPGGTWHVADDMNRASDGHGADLGRVVGGESRVGGGRRSKGECGQSAGDDRGQRRCASSDSRGHDLPPGRVPVALSASGGNRLSKPVQSLGKASDLVTATQPSLYAYA